MTPHEAAEILRRHNEWRRWGEDRPGHRMLDPGLIGGAMDVAVKYIEATPAASASEVTGALSWLRSALDCPTFAWDADQRAAAEAALTAALQEKSHE